VLYEFSLPTEMTFLENTLADQQLSGSGCHPNDCCISHGGSDLQSHGMHRFTVPKATVPYRLGLLGSNSGAKRVQIMLHFSPSAAGFGSAGVAHLPAADG
jgi:hypothetical protein